MLLSNQQKYIISVLRQIKYIRSCQLCALTAQHYRPQGIEISQHRMDVMLRQLRAGTNFVRLQEDINFCNFLIEHMMQSTKVLLFKSNMKLAKC